MIYLEKESKLPLYEQIYQQMKRDIESGTVKAGTLLPGIRTLSQTLGVARNTVDKAYTQLAVEGYISSRKGSGFAVNSNKSIFVSKSGCGCFPPSQIAAPEHLRKTETIKYDFQYGNFPPDCFPSAAWKKAISKALSSFGMTQYHEKQGNLSLRRELRSYLNQSRGVVCEEDQIVVGCGLHSSLDILCKLFADRKKIAMEEPGYNGAREVFQNNGFSLFPISVGAAGIDPASLKDADVCAAYVTPSHQFPMGSVLSVGRRKELLKWARDHGAFLIEDDYDSEYRYDANPVPSLQSLDQDDRVAYIGTFSKSFSPALRVNYMVLPKRLLPQYLRLFSSYSSPASWLTQEALARYVASGEYTRNVRRMCAAYRKRHDVLTQEISRQFGERVVIHGRGAGLHLILEFPKGADSSRLIQRAEEAGVHVYPVQPFWFHPENCPENLVFVGYSLLDEQSIREGIRALRQAWLL
ncbi:MocR-like pyridoxine biosynthesis transcription factor PdxR [Caproiciproducens sp. CPB-2]|uniref:MocR-like pyridoxine biosynthesis transcription factor PdxR n=1 Tax=Caproiciproducens sp. CPB-2 TaxID=3030017 RepID=UPI0023DC3065|nr:PLP-dependent aminotransferase family protein [Caproiciproducens sp. CPB-2]MDF1493166.1 PLP-dependent aminotransferase family protein [Caproiciproducens sp. CPB-2]